MMTMTIVMVLSLVTISALTYFLVNAMMKISDWKIKFESIKDFADKAGEQILLAEEKNKELSKHILEQTAEIENLKISYSEGVCKVPKQKHSKGK
jgi:hypothetical protein